MNITEAWAAEVEHNIEFQAAMQTLRKALSQEGTDISDVALLSADLIEKSFRLEAVKLVIPKDKSSMAITVNVANSHHVFLVEEDSIDFRLETARISDRINQGARVFQVDQYARMVSEIIIFWPKVSLEDLLAKNNLTLNEDK